MVGVLEIFLVRTHGRVPEDGVFQGPVRTHRRVPEAEFQGLRFLAAQLFFAKRIVFWFIGVFLRDHRFLQVPVLSSADFLNWYSIF